MRLNHDNLFFCHNTQNYTKILNSFDKMISIDNYNLHYGNKIFNQPDLIKIPIIEKENINNDNKEYLDTSQNNSICYKAGSAPAPAPPGVQDTCLNPSNNSNTIEQSSVIRKIPRTNPKNKIPANNNKQQNKNSNITKTNPFIDPTMDPTIDPTMDPTNKGDNTEISLENVIQKKPVTPKKSVIIVNPDDNSNSLEIIKDTDNSDPNFITNPQSVIDDSMVVQDDDASDNGKTENDTNGLNPKPQGNNQYHNSSGRICGTATI